MTVIRASRARCAVGGRDDVEERVHLDLGRQVEVRDLLLALGHPPRDGAAHRARRDGLPTRRGGGIGVDRHLRAVLEPGDRLADRDLVAGVVDDLGEDPDAVASISTVDLSVSISAMTSPRAIVSPTRLSQPPTLPVSMS